MYNLFHQSSRAASGSALFVFLLWILSVFLEDCGCSLLQYRWIILVHSTGHFRPLGKEGTCSTSPIPVQNVLINVNTSHKKIWWHILYRKESHLNFWWLLNFAITRFVSLYGRQHQQKTSVYLCKFGLFDWPNEPLSCLPRLSPCLQCGRFILVPLL